MSKTTVKKAIAGFGEPELRQLILDVYSKSKDAKELLDFYAEPNLDAKLGEYENLATKEIRRFRRGAYRPRMSSIRGAVRRFKVFEPDDEYLGRLMIHIATEFTRIGSEDFLPSAVNGQAINYLSETLAFLAAHRMLDEYLPRLSKAVDSMDERIGLYNNHLRAEMKKVIRTYS